MIVRNDDVSVDIDLKQFRRFCNICDRWGFRIIQCITPLGETLGIDSKMSNDEIVALGKNKVLTDNKPLVDYLLSRNDLIAIHGLWHTHFVRNNEIVIARNILKEIGLNPTYYVPPFNEVMDSHYNLGLSVSHKCQRIEDYHKEGVPTDEIAYLHSWRYFPGKWYGFDVLDKTLERIKRG